MASFEGRGGLVLIKSERVWRGGGEGGGICACKLKSFQGDKSDGLGTSIFLGGGVGAGVGRVGQLNMCVETTHYFEGINVTVLEMMHQFIMYILG